ncbi:uncharacterized protein LOC133283957 [Gastrolobium bilobum]|uniref:uncharacterized protein LOC133283957 n=1 Tax=Gastrolobium bilobum TaxID=150636 RepID=UPI002AB1DB54|nr:uncharacterized protein LOC133283957 [Gastrolobium bilobum]
MSIMPNSKEIRDAVFSFGPYKSPGKDGLNALFFQSQWDKGIDVPELLKDFRPISLCNVIYKTVTKIVAKRLKSHMAHLVMPNQCGFIKGRQGADNIIVAQEIIHSMNKKRGGKGWMTVKVNLEKAYDKISWEFMKNTLVDVGLLENIISLIMCYGEKVSKEKTKVFFSRNVNHTQVQNLSQLMGYSPINDLGKYLGIPLRHSRVTKSTFGYILNRMQARLNAWNQRTLSLAGKSTLARKAHLVSWETVCLPKNVGGLDFRKIKENNMAFIMKLGHRIMTDRNSLWVRVLRSKYKVEERLIPSISASANDSGLWKTIVKYWPQTLENSRIILGDGVHTPFWMDSWVPGCPQLVSLAVQPIPPTMTHCQVLQRTDSYREYLPENDYREVTKKVDRSWSGNITSPQCELPKVKGVVAKIKADHRRVHSAGNIQYPGSSEPRLVRSSGMRREWSFENLAENKDHSVSCH